MIYSVMGSVFIFLTWLASQHSDGFHKAVALLILFLAWTAMTLPWILESRKNLKRK